MKEQIDKQAIEEMKQQINIALARDCSKARCLTCEFINEENCEPSIIADALYNAGYRKQSEGRWEKRVFIIFDSEKVGYHCSECNTTWDTETNFCPNCGARMSGGKNE